MNKAIPEIKFAKKHFRLIAFIFDMLPLSIAISLLLDFAFSKIFGESPEVSSTIPLIITIGAISVLYLFLKDVINGVSIGKWIMGLRVADAKQRHLIPSRMRLFTRNLFLLIFPLEALILTGRNPKRLGDESAKTVVVENPHKGSVLPRAIVSVIILVLYFSTANLPSFSFFKNHKSYIIAEKAIYNDPEVNDITGGIVKIGSMQYGSKSTSGDTGKANYKIIVKGLKKSVLVEVYLVKESGKDWQVTKVDMPNLKRE